MSRTGLVNNLRVRDIATAPRSSLTAGAGGALRSRPVMVAASEAVYARIPARYEAAGGSGNVTAAGGCEWSAASNVAWLTLSAGALGAGNGSVSFNVAPNPTAQSRTGTLVVAGQTITVVQAGALASVSAAKLTRRGVGERADGSGFRHGVGHSYAGCHDIAVADDARGGRPSKCETAWAQDDSRRSFSSRRCRSTTKSSRARARAMRR